MFAGLFAGWVAFQAQSIISINQIGLAVWGWVFSGLIIGFEIKTRNVNVSELSSKKSGKAAKPYKSSAGSVLALFVATVLGILVGMPPYAASAKFKSALDSGNAQVIENSAYIWPRAYTRMVQVASILDENELQQQALQVAVDGTRYFPDNYVVWATLNSMTSATAEQKAQALVQMKRLDPLNPNLK
jgi:hypothetical protein